MAELANLNNQPNNPLSKKLNKILDTRLDSDKVIMLIQYCLICVYVKLFDSVTMGSNLDPTATYSFTSLQRWHDLLHLDCIGP